MQSVTPSFVRLLQFEIQRARDLYSLADASIDDLPRGARAAVRAAGDLYKEILAEVEDNKFDVFTKRARTSKAKKLILAGKAIIRAR
jgi:phytoene synthase